MKLGLLLIALAMGYRVCADAAKEKGMLRSLGLLVGAVVMGTSLVAGAFLISKYSCHGSCPWSKMKMEQPKVEQQRFTVQVQPNPALKK